MRDYRILVRAERLRLLVAAIGEEPTMDVRDTFASGIVPGGWVEYMSDGRWDLDPGTIERDIDLAFSCAEVAREIRERQWQALERADALIAAGDGGPLPPSQHGALARAILELGWHTTPEEDRHGGTDALRPSGRADVQRPWLRATGRVRDRDSRRGSLPAPRRRTSRRPSRALSRAGAVRPRDGMPRA